MEGVSILQLTSLTTIVTASIFLTWVAKRALAEVPIASKVPVWIYTGAIAAVLTYIANRVTGTLEGQTGVLMIDAVINGALASGIREWFTAGTKPLEDSGTARKTIAANTDGSVKPRLGVIVLPFLLASAVAASACGGLTPAPVTPNPTEAQIQATRAKAIEIATAVESVGNLVVEARRSASAAHAAGLITLAQRDAVNQAVIDLEPRAHAVIDIAATVTTDPQLRSTVQALMTVMDDFLAKLADGNEAMRTVAVSIRTALQVASIYLGGGR
ncbi:MAG: hypothetical protein NUW22_04875 [Acidobacteria bacterium]|nr:hypothetical protein [Acidobacteriota bacterium]